MSVLPSTTTPQRANRRRAHPRPPCRPGARRGAGRGRRRTVVPSLAGRVPYANLDHAASTPALDRQGSGRPGARDLLVGPPRRRPRLPADEHLVRAGPRRGRRLRRGPPGRRGGLHEEHDRLVGGAVQGPAEPHDDLRLRHRAPLDAAPVGPLPHGAPTHPPDGRGRALPPRRGARRAPVAAPARRRRGRLQRDRRDLARRALRAAGPTTAPGSRSTPPSSPPTARSTSPPGTRTTSRSPGARPTPRTARACSPADPSWLDAGTPYLSGGGATSSVTDESTTWATGPARHEGGSPNVLGAIAIAAAASAIRARREAIEAHETALLGALRDGPRRDPGVDLSIFRDDHDRVGVVAFTIEGWDSSLIPRSSPSSTGSACVTASSARTCSSTSSSMTHGASARPPPSARASASARRPRASSASSVASSPRRGRHRGHVDQGRARLGDRGRRPPRRRGPRPW